MLLTSTTRPGWHASLDNRRVNHREGEGGDSEEHLSSLSGYRSPPASSTRRTRPGSGPIWVGIGLGFDAKAMDFIVTSAKKDFPDYWPVDCARAYSLLPRWYGESGDWEKYAEIASSNAGGAGPETYSRIAIRLMSIHNDLFRETNVSWPRTKEGLELMMERYPDSKLIQSQAAKLGAMALDFHFAKERFDELGSQWIGAAWADADEFVIYRTAARRGRW